MCYWSRKGWSLLVHDSTRVSWITELESMQVLHLQSVFLLQLLIVSASSIASGHFYPFFEFVATSRAVSTVTTNTTTTKVGTTLTTDLVFVACIGKFPLKGLPIVGATNDVNKSQCSKLIMSKQCKQSKAALLSSLLVTVVVVVTVIAAK